MSAGAERQVSYEQIGQHYSAGRCTDPRIATRIWDALADAERVLNVGAGTGSYEPLDRKVIAVEPSAVMRAQRPAGSAPCIDASAEALPFPDKSFDAAMAVLTDHHWTDPLTGLREMTRVARRVVILGWDFTQIPRFWLVRDYLPDYGAAAARLHPTLAQRAQAIHARVGPVPIPWDCLDGFFHAYWRRPHAYLQEPVRRASSVWARLEPDGEQRAISALARDLASGLWQQRNAELLEIDEAELGARLLTTP
jgi:SAM-dependent methyltransferase